MKWKSQRAPLLVLCFSACAHAPPQPHIPLTASAQLCDDPSLGDKDLCLPFDKITTVLTTGRLDVVQVKNPDSGVAGAKVLVVSAPDQKLIFKAKWKLSKKGGEGFDNSPRKEIAAYQFQKLFLEPGEYVVPPTVGRCLAADPVSGRPPADHERTFADVPCVFGLLAYWLEHVTEKGVLDRERFARDTAYRNSVADLNVLTYLIDHRDTRPANFLISTDPRRPRVFAIDNGLAFSGFRNPRAAFVREWNYIIVPALSRARIERLRRITRADLDRMAVVTQYRIKDGMLEEVAPTAPLPNGDGVRRDGDTIQLGLTKREIDSLESRLKQLLAMVDRGAITLF